jgi:DNA-directed RNA polymerase alpha subunit
VAGLCRVFTGQGEATLTELPKTSRPAAGALTEASIASLEDLARRTEREVQNLHGMGPKAFGILKAAMAEEGLSFAKE